MPHQTKMIPTGIASACDNNYCFILKERGSTGTKGIAQRCGIIDSGYRNEWFVPVTNTTDKLLIIGDENVAIQFKDYDVIFYPTTKAICQALVIPVPTCEVEEVSYDELTKITSERGMGALGSSNK
jgi:dUTP pyrophosphatase